MAKAALSVAFDACSVVFSISKAHGAILSAIGDSAIYW